jgi:hypothetical protein
MGPRSISVTQLLQVRRWHLVVGKATCAVRGGQASSREALKQPCGFYPQGESQAMDMLGVSLFNTI